MSVRRYQAEGRPLEKHRSIEFAPQPERPYCLKRFNRSRNKVNTKSLQSIEINRGSAVLPTRSRNNRRKLLSLERNDHSQTHTERVEFMQSGRVPHRPMRTIEVSLEAKQKQIKDCIQLMQGVLSEIQNQKSQKSGLVVKHTDQPYFPLPQQTIERTAIQNLQKEAVEKEGSLSKFESYVRNVCNVRQDSKVIILRKAKTKSLVTNSAVRSTALLNVNKFQTIREAKPKEIAPYDPRRRKERPLFGGVMEELECSSIECNNNQSSFISSIGKEALMKQLEEEREKSTLDPNSKLVHRLKNHRKLKNVFPDGFF